MPFILNKFCRKEKSCKTMHEIYTHVNWTKKNFHPLKFLLHPSLPVIF